MLRSNHGTLTAPTPAAETAHERAVIERRGPAHGEGIRDLVRALVARNALVSADVVPRDGAHPLGGRGERFPEVAVHDVAAFRRPPAASSPTVDPIPDAADDVRGVGVDGDRSARGADVTERLDARAQLHAIVRGVTRAAAELGDVAVRGHG